MAITDYVFQKETVQKQFFQRWLVNKLLASGWKQVGSNPPVNDTDATPGRFYVFKGKRAIDDQDTYIAINFMRIQGTNSAAYSTTLFMYPMLDYTPGAPGTAGTSTTFQALNQLAANSPSTSAVFAHVITGVYSSTLHTADLAYEVRFCITPHNATIITRSPVYIQEKGNIMFFGLPDQFSQEKNSGLSSCMCSGVGTSNSATLMLAETPLNIPVTNTAYTSSTGYYVTITKSPDINGNFPMIPIYFGDTTYGIRGRMPSFYACLATGLIDGDQITADGMTFEVISPQYTWNFAQSGLVYAYRIQ